MSARLAATIVVTTLFQSTAGWAGNPTGGDFNGDGIVNAADYAILMKCMGMAGATAPTKDGLDPQCKMADLDWNGTLTATDVAIMRGLIGRTVNWITAGGPSFLGPVWYGGYLSPVWSQSGPMVLGGHKCQPILPDTLPAPDGYVWGFDIELGPTASGYTPWTLCIHG